jgi:hypothetical protein
MSAPHKAALRRVVTLRVAGDRRPRPATQWWINLSTAIVFGLGFATVLTLIVTPAMLMAIENMRVWRIHWVMRLRGWFGRPAQA